MGDAGLLWVIKTPSSKSLTHSTGNEKILIGAHIQRGRNQAKKERVTSSISKRGPLAFNFRRNNDVVHPVPDSLQAVECKSRSDEATNEERVIALIQQATSNSTAVQLFRPVPGNYNAVDPFLSSCVRLNEQIHTIMQHFIKVSRPSLWLVEARASPVGTIPFQVNPYVVIQRTFSNEMDMFAILASMSSQMGALGGEFWHKVASFYIQKALIATRQHIESKPTVDCRLIMDMFHLSVAEFYRMNVQAGYVHLRACATLTRQIGGLKSLFDTHLMALLVLADGGSATLWGIPPIFSADEFDPGLPLTDTIHDDLQNAEGPWSPIGTIGYGLLRSPKRLVVPETLQRIISSLVICARTTLDCIANAQKVAATPGLLRQLQLHVMAIRHRLSSQRFEEPTIEVLREALIMWITTVGVPKGSGREEMCFVAAHRLQGKLGKISSSEWSGHEEVYAWILSIGAMGTGGAEAQNYFAEAMLSLMAGSQMNADFDSEEGLRRFSEEFFYVDAIERPMLRTLAQKLALKRNVGPDG